MKQSPVEALLKIIDQGEVDGEGMKVSAMTCHAMP